MDDRNEKGLTATLSNRDGKHGDYRTAANQPKSVEQTFGEQRAPGSNADGGTVDTSPY